MGQFVYSIDTRNTRLFTFVHFLFATTSIWVQLTADCVRSGLPTEIPSGANFFLQTPFLAKICGQWDNVKVQIGPENGRRRKFEPVERNKVIEILGYFFIIIISMYLGFFRIKINTKL